MRQVIFLVSGSVGSMASWGQITRLPVVLTRVCCNANKQLFQVKARALSCHPALRNQAAASDENSDMLAHTNGCNGLFTSMFYCFLTRGVEIGVTRDGETIVCFHPASDFPYELTQPIPRPETTLDSTETHDLVLKSQLHKDVLDDKKSPGVEELAKMFYTTKHRWYPVGQYHTRRRNRNPPKDR
ncbi:hypothetical protein QTP70_033924 [Hemibagrus guttatus]|uniref:Large ribosomal subunit protein mL42 n=1 Tax=Hemibagrus guttatus TaxID=175788 RepID=A0AAE0QDC1_9TELE|nr:hypothetical protein QTP70_033924 [Hemibagrus guttatus]